MKYENEITVEIDISLDELKSILKNNCFKVIDEYDLKDIYMINKNDINSDPLEKLKNCILLRHVIESNIEEKKIIYKYKEYNEKREIIKQGKASCKIESIDDMKNVLEMINYKEFIRIFDHLTVYANKEDNLVVQEVNDKHIYIEIEQDSSNIRYSSVEDMKNVFKKYNIPIKNNDYFVKKAEIEINEVN